VKNDFTELQKIYEGYMGQSIDYGPSSNMQYTPAQAAPGQSYRKGNYLQQVLEELTRSHKEKLVRILQLLYLMKRYL